MTTLHRPCPYNLMLSFCRTYPHQGTPPLLYLSTHQVGTAHILKAWGVWAPLYLNYA